MSAEDRPFIVFDDEPVYTAPQARFPTEDLTIPTRARPPAPEPPKAAWSRAPLTGRCECGKPSKTRRCPACHSAHVLVMRDQPPCETCSRKALPGDVRCGRRICRP